MKSWAIVGYTYNTENYTPDGLVKVFAPVMADHPDGVEAVLDGLAKAFAIDRYDEQTFDSSEFPKIIFADWVQDGETFLDENGQYVDPLD